MASLVPTMAGQAAIAVIMPRSMFGEFSCSCVGDWVEGSESWMRCWSWVWVWESLSEMLRDIEAARFVVRWMKVEEEEEHCMSLSG